MNIDKIISIVKSLREEAVMAAPTNNVGAGKIAGTREAGDDPPVKKKKRYIYSGRGSRRMWLTNKKDG
tara:strand:+ start:1297 stop:1500 length:204 start_codon:yes stop_codon:yes gene_type:complete